MKKRKAYEVSVINKTYSKTNSDQTKFYTSDTALELNFQLKEVEYDFDSAEIILLNIGDRSLVTRPVAKSAEGFTYELEDDIIERFGKWKGQLKFNEGGDIYVSSPVIFRIENDLSNDRPPQLTDVNSWKNLRNIADELISDIRSELELVAGKISEIEGAETTRKQAENERVEAESSRVSAEEQRKINHANRSAELDSKADKVVLENLTLPPTQVPYAKDFEGNTSDVWYANIEARYIQYNSGRTRLTLRDYGNSNNPTVVEFKSQVSENFESYSVRASGKINGTRLLMSSDLSPDLEVDVRNLIVLNLTETFGTGNEPTKEEMDELIKVTGYIDGEYALNNKEMLIWTLSLVRNNRNAIIALGGII